MSTPRYFGTDGIRGYFGRNPITCDFFYILGKAIKLYLELKTPDSRIVIGRDTRESGALLLQALLEGLQGAKTQVFNLGVVPTPAVAQLGRLRYSMDLGLSISASHNPYHDNGIKFFNAQGEKWPIEEELFFESILQQVNQEHSGKHISFSKAPLRDIVTEAFSQYIDLYQDFFKQIQLKDKKIIFDCAHGAMSPLGNFLRHRLQCQSIIIGDSPDGKNINNAVGSEHTAHLSALVLAEKAWLGIAFDGDGDRIVFCDEQGNILAGETILSCIAQYLQNSGRLSHSTIVTTQQSNSALDFILKEKGIQTKRTEIGDRHVVLGMDQWKANWGGENSGHFILRDKTSTGDGLLTALEVLKALEKQKTSLAQWNQSFELLPCIQGSLKVEEKKPLPSLPKLQQCLVQIQKKLAPYGRAFVRYSGTENKIRFLIEGSSKDLIDDCAISLKQQIAKDLQVIN